MKFKNDDAKIKSGGDNTVKTNAPLLVEMKLAPATWCFMYITLPSWHFIRTQIKGGLLGFIWGLDIFFLKIPLVKTYVLIHYIFGLLS